MGVHPRLPVFRESARVIHEGRLQYLGMHIWMRCLGSAVAGHTCISPMENRYMVHFFVAPSTLYAKLLDIRPRDLSCTTKVHKLS